MALTSSRIGITICLVTAAFLAASCGSPSETADEIPVASGATIPIVEDTVPAITVIDQPTNLEQSDCLICHADKQRLIDTARPEEEHISENSGVG